MTIWIAWLVFPLVLGVLSLGCGLLAERAAGVEIPSPLLLPLGFTVVVADRAVRDRRRARRRRSRRRSSLRSRSPGSGSSFPGGAGSAGGGSRRRSASSPFSPRRSSSRGTRRLADTSSSTTPRRISRCSIARCSTATRRPGSHRRRTRRRCRRASRTATRSARCSRSAWAGSSSRKTSRGCGSRIWRAWRHCWPAASTSWPSVSLARRGCARWSRSAAGRRRCSTATRSGEESRSSRPPSSWCSSPHSCRSLSGATVEFRGVLPLAVGFAALLAVLSLGGAAWIAPAAVVVIVLLWRSRGPARAGRTALALGAATVIFSIPSLWVSARWLGRSGSFTSADELGNLLHRLSWLQAFGIWPSGDFRVAPHNLDVTRALVVLAAAAAGFACVVAVRRRAVELPTAITSAAFACVVYLGLGSPWIGGKALASASPIVLAAAFAGAAAVFERGRRVEAIAGGVVAARRSALVECPAVPRRRSRPELEAGRARDDRPPLQRPGPDAADGIRAVRRTTFPPRDGRRGGVRAAATPCLSCVRAACRRPASRRTSTSSTLGSVLPYRTLVLRRSGIDEPPSVRLCAGLDRAVLPGLAAPGVLRIDHRSRLAREPCAAGRRPVVQPGAGSRAACRRTPRPVGRRRATTRDRDRAERERRTALVVRCVR